MDVLYFVLYLLAFISFGVGFAKNSNKLIALGLASWVLVSLLQSVLLLASK